MSLSFFLEDFGATKTDAAVAPSSDPTLVSDTTQEEHRIEAYEQGYKAGWDDAAAAQSDEKDRIGADFAQNLQELSFTYAEVRAKMLESMEPLLKEMVASVLPQIAADNLGALILQELNSAMAGQTNVPVELMVAPSNRAALEATIPENIGFPLQIFEEPTLGEGQVSMKIGKSEKQVDLLEVLDRATQAVDGFFAMNEEAKTYG